MVSMVSYLSYDIVSTNERSKRKLLIQVKKDLMGGCNGSPLAIEKAIVNPGL